MFPISIGVITTIAAFLVMLGSPMHGYQQLGILGAIGVVFSAAFALVVLPILVPATKKPGQPPLWLTRWWEKYFRWESRQRGWLLLGVVVLTVVTGLGLKRLRFEGDVSKLNGISESTRRDDALIQSTWGNALGFTMVVSRGATPEVALTQNDFVAKTLARETNVASVFSLSSICPGPDTQSANVKRWNEFWTPPGGPPCARCSIRWAPRLGYREGAFARFWQIVEGTPVVITPETFRGTPFENVIGERVASGADGTASARWSS